MVVVDKLNSLRITIDGERPFTITTKVAQELRVALSSTLELNKFKANTVSSKKAITNIRESLNRGQSSLGQAFVALTYILEAELDK